jgi:hypothetical protein
MRRMGFVRVAGLKIGMAGQDQGPGRAASRDACVSATRAAGGRHLWLARSATLMFLLVFGMPQALRAIGPAACSGDCNQDGQVTVGELLAMVNIALGNAPFTTCPGGDANLDGQITVDEILAAVDAALNDCGQFAGPWLAAANVTGTAGETVGVPITVNAADADVAGLAANFAVVPQSGAPPIVEQLTYAATGRIAPDVELAVPPDALAIGYFNINPPLTGTTQVGTLMVPIPAGATGSYEVQLSKLSALDLQDNAVALAGRNGGIRLVPTGSTPISLSPQVAKPFDTITVNVSGPVSNTGNVVLLDLGSGFQAQVPIPPAQSQITFAAPPGVVDANDGFVAGDVTVRLLQTTNGQTSVSGPATLHVLDLPQPIDPPGTVTRAFISAVQRIASASVDKLTGLKNRSGISVTAPTDAIMQVRTELDQVSGLLDQIPVQLGKLNDTQSVLDARSVAISDRVLLALIESLQDGGSTGAQVYQAATTDDLINVDVLVGNLTANFRDVVRKEGTLIGVGIGVIGVSTAILGTPELALAASILGAQSFVVTTAVGAAISITLDAAPDYIEQGQATWNDARGTVSFLLDQVKGYATSLLLGKGLGAVFGDQLGEAINVSVDAWDTYNDFLDNEVDPALEDGRLPGECAYPSCCPNVDYGAACEPCVPNSTCSYFHDACPANTGVVVAGPEGGCQFMCGGPDQSVQCSRNQSGNCCY